ncbi:PAS/PAC sensor hybrid histidine kinase [Olavius algarvensis associated proteobacterium Delta 3]|nr:hypothetical protein D3OALGB2SA_701 [Olavius algarvensis associated proteobacterium Delta 3]CAB5157812.1 PAS/PAC sensor hybrid histidine kinase [Olavius algarvensis associated proteobacterium Delta 3]
MSERKETEHLTRQLRQLERKVADSHDATEEAAQRADFYRELFEMMNVGILVCDPMPKKKDFPIRAANTIGQRIARSEDGAVVGLGIRNALPGLSSVRLFDVFQRVQRSGMPETILPSYHSSGDIIGWFESTIHRLSSGLIAVFLTDVSQTIRSQEEARSAEHDKSFILDATFEMLIYSDPDLRVRWLNQAAADTFGVTKESLIGRFCYEIWHNDDSPCQACPLLKARDTQTPQEAIIQSPDGRDWLLRGYPVFNEDEEVTGMVEFAQDITDRMRAEKALRESEERFRAMAENINDVFWLFDWIERRVIYVSPAYETVWGRSVSDLYSNYDEWADSIHPADLEFATESFESILTTGGGTPREYRIQRPDGEIRWISDRGYTVRDENGNIRYITGIAEDVTQRKAAEERLRRYEQMVLSSQDFIALIDRDYSYQAANNAYLRIFSIAQEAIIGQHAAAVFGEELFESTIRARIDQCLEGEEVKVKGWYDLPSLGRRFLDVAYYPCFDEDSSVSGVVVSGRDITPIRKLEDQLFQAQKMEAIGTLAGGIAHDFNNLLMGIQGRTSLMMTETDENHPYGEHLKGIETHIKKAVDLTQQLLGFARGGKYQVQTLDIKHLVQNQVHLFNRTRKEIAIHEKYAPDTGAVEGDHGQVRQVLLNIFINAWHAMPGGGDIFVETEKIHLESEIASPIDIAPGPYVKITVTDSGVGMDESIRQRIFEPFFTTREMGRGTGLGLASAYGIVRNHGGFITVDSDVGRGSTFSIFLPSSQRQLPLPKERLETPVPGAGTVLLVDDEQMVLEVGRKMLERLGYAVIVAGDGSEAIELYTSKRHRIDLVILDMIMPGMSGKEVFAAIKGENPEIKVILSSGYSMNEQVNEIMDIGCRGFLQKPFSLASLSAKVKEVMEGH